MNKSLYSKLHGFMNKVKLIRLMDMEVLLHELDFECLSVHCGFDSEGSSNNVIADKLTDFIDEIDFSNN